MALYTRTNAWDGGGTFEQNATLLWYAKGVGVMMSRMLSDPSSWWFFAAIHGEYVSMGRFPGWVSIPPPPSVEATPTPVVQVWQQYWDQCQHQSWYFLPWHRGYLIALEAQIRSAVIDLGGPQTWALPYWDYFGAGSVQYTIPPAFSQRRLPDDSANPLYVALRYGPDGDGNVFIPTATGIAQHPNDPNFVYGVVTQSSMSNDLFTGSNARTLPPGFGGQATGYSHGGGTSGNLESNPHNLVHSYVGGSGGGRSGLMSDPGTAALDPIFYLHHANIDRMWASWNLANANPSESAWQNGPAAIGQHNFVMPLPSGQPWVYTPADMNSLSLLNYAYDSLPAPPSVAPAATMMADRLTRLGALAAAARVKEGAPVAADTKMELMGASATALPITGAGATTTVTLDPGVRDKMAASLAAPSEAAPPDRVLLNLENVRGTHDAAVLSVFINLPEGAYPADHPELLAGSVALFGLRSASLADGSHAGQGLNFVLDITDIVDRLHLEKALDTDTLTVRIVPHRPIPDQAEITIGRISVYRQGA